MKARDLFERVQVIIQDEGGTRWPIRELAMWLNDGQRAVVEQKPTASVATVDIPLVAGAEQQLTYPYLSLLRVYGNAVTADSDHKPRRAVTVSDRDMLQAYVLDWQDMRHAKQQAAHYLYEETAPRQFMVYPPNDGSGALKALVSVLPGPVDSTVDDPDDIGGYDVPLGLDDLYFNALVHYVLAMSYLKDAQFNAGAMQRVVLHAQQFGTALGVRVSMDAFMSPNAKPGVPGVTPGVESTNG